MNKSHCITRKKATNMNLVINNFKQATRLTAILLKNCGNLSREYATTIADYKISWVRPKRISNLLSEKSGDQGLKIEVKPSDFCNMYNESPELKGASDIVKKMFTLQFLPRKKSTNARKEKILELVKRHKFDLKSPEAQIAVMTNKIHLMQKHMMERPKDTRAKICLKELIDKRRKWLKHLRTWDYRRFEWILEKLNLIYKSSPELPFQITRKDSLRRLTEKHCDKIVQDKLNTYKRELKALQKDFYIEKAEKLAFIREEELACGLQPSVSEEDVVYAKHKTREYQT